MKTGFYLTICCLFILSIFVGYTKYVKNYDGVEISVHDDTDTYLMEAHYNVNSTSKVQWYINRCIAPNSLFSSDHDYLNVTTSLQDGTSYYVKSSPGHMKISIDKRKNSTASVMRIRKMCTGIKELLTKY